MPIGRDCSGHRMGGDSAQMVDKMSGVGDHCNATSHSVSIDNVKILDREHGWRKSKVKEAIHIKQGAPSMNSIRAGCYYAVHYTVLVVKLKFSFISPTCFTQIPLKFPRGEFL